MNTYLNLDSFTQAYVDAALWTTDPNPPSGMDYAECGAAKEYGQRLRQDWLNTAIADCAKFQAENESPLSEAGTDDQNGHDFWLTRNGHGTGFWDRGYPDEIGDALTDAAHSFGEVYLDWEYDLETEKEEA